jgi:hypothetical protein
MFPGVVKSMNRGRTKVDYITGSVIRIDGGLIQSI